MDRQEYYRKSKEIIDLFDNGEEMFRTSATFNRVVQMLIRDVGEREIIGQLCQALDDNQKAFELYITRCLPPEPGR